MLLNQISLLSALVQRVGPPAPDSSSKMGPPGPPGLPLDTHSWILGFAAVALIFWVVYRSVQQNKQQASS